MNREQSTLLDNSEKDTTALATEPEIVKKLQISNPTETKDCVKITATAERGNIK